MPPVAEKAVIGIDFGTLSARGLLLRASDGCLLASAVHNYEHGVIDQKLPGTSIRLPAEFALQDPADYLKAVEFLIPALLREAGLPGASVAAIGTDFTSCTVLPTRADGTPLCFDPKWRRHPHAWVKLWKHHAPQPDADRINQIARERQEEFLQVYGGKYSSEWLFSKILETLRLAPEVYAAADRFIEACDWIVWQLSGVEKRNLSAAGFKGMWVHSSSQGRWHYPDPSFFKALHPRLTRVVQEKLSPDLYPLSSPAGGLTPAWAAKLGLNPGTTICMGNIDAHAAVPGAGVAEPGALVMIMGTSTCHLLIGEQRKLAEGICGVVENGIINGAWGYEAGQPGVGDMFAWYVEHACPPSLHASARKADLSVHALLENEAATLAPGESGLVALDWWNGNRSVLVDADLSGLLLGLKLGTRPHEIYRALLEASAFGTRKIVEAFESSGIPIPRVVACGGLPQKNKLLMQIYADVLGRPIQVSHEEHASAKGAAIHAAVAAGLYPSLQKATSSMAQKGKSTYKPKAANVRAYRTLYTVYNRLHDFFGRENPDLMKSLTNTVRALRS